MKSNVVIISFTPNRTFAAAGSSIHIEPPINAESSRRIIDNFEFEVKTNINEVANQRSFSIYPNPSSTSIKIDINERFSTINIIDIQGKMVLQSKQKTIDINGLENGIYVVQIETENGVLNSKFVKQ